MSIATYILAALVFWGVPAANAEPAAKDIAAVVSDQWEPSMFKAGDPDKAETALVVAGVGVKESNYVDYVADGRCNSKAWRTQYPGRKTMCDGGAAWSFWQIHLGYSSPSGWRTGIALDGDGWRYDPDGLQGKDLVENHQDAARLALHMMRPGMLRTGTLCAYTGEHGDCPKARERLKLAVDYFRAHPYLPPQLELR